MQIDALVEAVDTKAAWQSKCQVFQTFFWQSQPEVPQPEAREPRNSCHNSLCDVFWLHFSKTTDSWDLFVPLKKPPLVKVGKPLIFLRVERVGFLSFFAHRWMVSPSPPSVPSWNIAISMPQPCYVP